MSEPALGLYRAAVAAARAPGFYARHGVPDTPDGRFDMIALHVFLALRRLKREPDPASGAAVALAQALTDLMFADMDRNLREMGVGDLGVGKQVKGLAAAFRGRVVAYDAALERTDGDAGLAEALGRNLWRGAGQAAGKGGATLAMYVRAADGLLAAQPWGALAAGKAIFPPPPDAPL
ncbi:MAG: ubiquinol-cytochrome C chaperone [Rhodospirillales bacterium]|nr:ubiquinol-cytochrome C chaperone [Rhodospirillales bacterium]MSP79996.1 ubiquinol-cytochrome C chaperone [Rhodospirillales bacterium]